MLNSKSRIVLSSLSALGLIGVGVCAHHADENLMNSLSNVKTSTVKAESKQISDSKKSEEQSVTTYSAPAASIGSTIGSEIASSIENKTNDDTVKQDVEPVVESELVDASDVTESEQNVESKSVDTTDVNKSEQNIEPDVESKSDTSVDNSETNVEPDNAPITEPVVEQVSDKNTNSTNSEINVQDSDVNKVASEEVSQESIVETKKVDTTENITVNNVTSDSLSDSLVDSPVVETPKLSAVVETPVVHEEVKPSVLSVSHDQSNTYPVGQCTWGVKSLASWVGNYWGNANQWGDSARRAGFRTGHTPQVGSVIVFPNVMYEGENYGHVAYVTAVNNDGTIEVLEANWGGNQQIGNYRGAFTPSSDAYYIYPNN